MLWLAADGTFILRYETCDTCVGIVVVVEITSKL